MKVITQGSNPNRKPAQGTCYTCKSVVEVTRDDCKYIDNYDVRDPREGPYWQTRMSCPVCHHAPINVFNTGWTP